jgi:hypothetical protein
MPDFVVVENDTKTAFIISAHISQYVSNNRISPVTGKILEIIEFAASLFIDEKSSPRL